MKKLVYVILVLAVLLGIAYLLKGQKATVESVEETVAVEETAAVDAAEGAAEEAIVVVDEEPVAEENTAEENTVVDENVVEENPEATADDGETVVD